MKTIHKYKLEEGINTIQAHWIEQFLSVDMYLLKVRQKIPFTFKKAFVI